MTPETAFAFESNVANAITKYSLLDQYVMGLVRDIDVPKMFYVENPVPVSASTTAESAPRTGVTFSGTRRDVLINDVIAVMGARTPAADTAPKVHRQAFLFVVSKGRTAAPPHRQDRTHPPRVGAVLRTGHRESRPRRHEPAVRFVATTRLPKRPGAARRPDSRPGAVSA